MLEAGEWVVECRHPRVVELTGSADRTAEGGCVKERSRYFLVLPGRAESPFTRMKTAVGAIHFAAESGICDHVRLRGLLERWQRQWELCLESIPGTLWAGEEFWELSAY